MASPKPSQPLVETDFSVDVLGRVLEGRAVDGKPREVEAMQRRADDARPPLCPGSIVVRIQLMLRLEQPSSCWCLVAIFMFKAAAIIRRSQAAVGAPGALGVATTTRIRPATQGRQRVSFHAPSTHWRPVLTISGP